ncbi:hypothetical protein PR048_006474 [Dryococelus australis]|uniref:Uncharacterized protein n=1 Tax=Dryococelus australis TaxID=614101 RepID=A0ABQ9IDB4_9NEOP|nr:hypothetical protein PR048_006474 [Dryococelus australis]
MSESLVLFYKNYLHGTVDKLKIDLKFLYRTIARLNKCNWPNDALGALRLKSCLRNSTSETRLNGLTIHLDAVG